MREFDMGHFKADKHWNRNQSTTRFLAPSNDSDDLSQSLEDLGLQPKSGGDGNYYDITSNTTYNEQSYSTETPTQDTSKVLFDSNPVSQGSNNNNNNNNGFRYTVLNFKDALATIQDAAPQDGQPLSGTEDDSSSDDAVLKINSDILFSEQLGYLTDSTSEETFSDDKYMNPPRRSRRKRLAEPASLDPISAIPVTDSGFGPNLSVDDMTRSLYGAEDPLWDLIKREAQTGARNNSQIGSYLHASILNHNSLEDSLSVIISHQLRSEYFLPIQWTELFQEALQDDPVYRQAIRRDLLAAMRRDPASTHPITIMLFNKGFQALESYRLGNWLLKRGRKSLALYLQSTISARFGVDIHPGAQMGLGILIDHASGIVIGETATVGDDCSILHNVTLGGTGKETGNRHPKVGRGVLIGAGVSILGNIPIGDFSRITPGSVVLKAVTPYSVVSGVPAKMVGDVKLDMGSAMPSEEHQHILDLSDSDNLGIDGVGI